MRVAITGASGNLGSAVLRHAVGSEHHLVGISRRDPGLATPPSAGAARKRTPEPDWLPADLEDPASADRLGEALAGYDAVVHLAWKIQPGHDQEQLRRTNVLGTRNLLTAAARAGVGQIVVASSVGAYSRGPKDTPVAETWPVDGIPTSSYSRYKAQVELLLNEFEQQHPEIVLTRLRPALVFQAGAASEIVRLFLGPLVPTRLIGRVASPVIPLPADLIFQAVHADDVAAAAWTVLEQRAAGAFNVAAPTVLTPDHLARALGAGRAVAIPTWALRGVVAAAWHARLQPSEPGWIDLATQCPVMSTQKLQNLGWTAKHTAPEALSELVSGIRTGAGDDAYPPLVGRDQ
jgi:UDP-glucose 4-epimerase